MNRDGPYDCAVARRRRRQDRQRGRRGRRRCRRARPRPGGRRRGGRRRRRCRRWGEQRRIDIASVVDPPDGVEQRLVPVELAGLSRRRPVHAGEAERRPHRLEDARRTVVVGTRDHEHRTQHLRIALGRNAAVEDPEDLRLHGDRLFPDDPVEADPDQRVGVDVGQQPGSDALVVGHGEHDAERLQDPDVDALGDHLGRCALRRHGRERWVGRLDLRVERQRRVRRPETAVVTGVRHERERQRAHDREERGTTHCTIIAGRRRHASVAGRRTGQTRVARPAQNGARNSRFRIFPDPVFGSSSDHVTVRGTL